MSTYNIRIVEEKSRIVVNPKFISENGMEYKKFIHITFGMASKEVAVIVDEKLEHNVIVISSNIIEGLKIPTFTSYHIQFENNQIVIGPLIGIVLGTKKNALYRKLRALNSYVKQYELINGLIVGFTIEDLNRNKLTVDGLVYNPLLKIWERREVPYPKSILKRGIVKQTDREYIYTLYGEKFFNYKKIDKWEIHERLEQFPQIEKYLPKALLYEDSNNLLSFLNTHQNIYVKPIAGNQGLGIYNIIKKNNIIKVKTRKKGENLTFELKNDTALDHFTKENLKQNQYIMQQTLDLIVKDKILDFRIGLDKDSDGKWKHNMFVTRVGGDQSIVSNIASGGEVLYPKVALNTIYDLTDENSFEMEKLLLKISYEMADCLDETSINLGKIALDLAITKDLEVYLIEINNTTPDDSLMRHLGNKEKITEIRHENIQYAKYLAGFGSEDNKSSNIQFGLSEQWQDKTYLMTFRANKKNKRFINQKLSGYFEKESIIVEKDFVKLNMHYKAKLTATQLENFVSFVKNDELLSEVIMLIE